MKPWWPAIAVPAGTLLLIMLWLAWTAPATGRTPAARAAVRRRLAIWSSSLTIGMWGVAMGGKLLGVRDDYRGLEWFYALVGLAGWVLARLDT